MNEQVDRSTERAPEKLRFQFGMKHLMALPVVLAVYFAIATYTGGVFAILIVAALLGIAGLFFSATRQIATVALAAVAITPFLLPYYSPCYEAARRCQCTNRLKLIALALHSYHDVYGSFPPAYIANEDGRPMHSWRVLILPFLEQQSLYDQYDFDEPWNGPNNSKIAAVGPDLFHCPSECAERCGDTSEEHSSMTNYVAIVGPTAAWPGSRPACFKDFTDGTSETVLVVEVANSGIHWMEPRDLHVLQMAPNINPPTGQGISSYHADFGGAQVAFADGSVHFLSIDITPEVLRALLTRAGGETTFEY